MRFALVLTALFLLTAQSPAAEPIKVGIIGLDNYQAVAFTQLFHDPKAAGDLAGLKVIAAFPAGSPDIEESMRELPKWVKDIQTYGVEIAKSPEDVLKRCDAVLIMSVDGRAHLEQLKPCLRPGSRYTSVGHSRRRWPIPSRFSGLRRRARRRSSPVRSTASAPGSSV